MITGLIIILLLVLFLPFTRIVERNLEVFLFIMGIASVLVSQVLDGHLILEALIHPINITLAVLIAGLLFRWFHGPIEKGILGISKAMPYRLFIGLFVIILGLLSSVITAIIAAIVLVAVVTVLRLDRKSEVRLVISACFAIGLGAALTPIGEPLSTIVVSKLDEDFFYLLRLVGSSVIPSVIIFGIVAAFAVKSESDASKDLAISEMAAGREQVGESKEESSDASKDLAISEMAAGKEQVGESIKESGEKKEIEAAAEVETESYAEIIIRSLKIYLFVMALTFLGAGFEPFIERFLLSLSPLVMYWINMISAILDNATLAAAEISPAMSEPTIKAILMGLLISGGMLIPGNIPNIIAAGKLRITSLEYAHFAVPVGLIAMLLYFILLIVIG